jgi:hypothetical protein
MAERPRFRLIFAPDAIEHLDQIESKYHSLLRRAIKEQLTYTPAEETRNRKPLEPPAPFASSWEIRCGPDHRFPVFYDVELASQEVRILAIGIKIRNRLLIGEEEYET